MSNNTFHPDTFLEYYKVEIDEDSLQDRLNDLNEGKLRSCSVSDCMLKTVTSSCVNDFTINVSKINEESGEEVDVEVYICTDYKYTTYYRLLIEQLDISKCEEALQQAIERGDLTFVVDVGASVYAIEDLYADVDGCYAKPEIDEREFCYVIDACFYHDPKILTRNPSIQEVFKHPEDKTVRLICTIPN